VITSQVQSAGNRLYLIGPTRNELGGSHRLLIEGRLGARVPRVDLALARRIFRALHRAIATGLVRACHDLSEGGLGVAAAEMTFGSQLGVEIDLRGVPCAGFEPDVETILWSESPSRFLVEVAPADVEPFEALFSDLPFGGVGSVLGQAELRITGLAGETLLAEQTTKLKSAWRRVVFSTEE
jgi:phosphoribosylformylglycinamidine synthase